MFKLYKTYEFCNFVNNVYKTMRVKGRRYKI